MLFFRWIFCCTAYFACAGTLWSQHSFAEFVGIDRGKTFPEDLLAGRSAVVVRDVSYAPALHSGLLRSSVDAVAYFQEDELLSGTEATSAFARWMRKRDIRTLLFLYPISTNSEEPIWGLSIAEFSGDGRLVSSNSKAWHTQGPIQAVSDNLYGEVYSVGLRQENFLLPDEVEFFRRIRLPRKKFLTTYPYDAKNTTLAVAKPSYALRHAEQSDLPPFLKKKLESEQNLLEEALKIHYSHSYKMLPYSGDDKDIFDQGHQYLLLHMRGRVSFLKSVFNRGVVQQQASDSLEYVFYIKQVFTRDVFIGRTWSSNRRLDVALQKFLGSP